MRRIRETVSVANSKALVETNKGCTTFSSNIFEMIPCMLSHDGHTPTHLLHVDARVLLAKSMLISQLSNDLNRVQTGILGECGRDDLERFGEGLETVCFFAL